MANDVPPEERLGSIEQADTDKSFAADNITDHQRKSILLREELQFVGLKIFNDSSDGLQPSPRKMYILGNNDLSHPEIWTPASIRWGMFKCSLQSIPRSPEFRK